MCFSPLDKIPCDKYSCDKMSCHHYPIFIDSRVAELRRGTTPRRRRASSARRRTGWLLVDVGLRLALR